MDFEITNEKEVTENLTEILNLFESLANATSETELLNTYFYIRKRTESIFIYFCAVKFDKGLLSTFNK